jgi:16S rRNA processing protein RimM
MDLIGLEVRNLQGVPLGRVIQLLETAAQQVLLVEGERERLIPFIESVVVSVDVAGGSLVVDWDADF